MPDAIRCLEAVVTAQPDHDAAWSQLGQAQKQAGNLNAALLAYQLAVQCAPQNRNARLGLAALYRYGGLMTEARRQLEYLVAHGLSCHIVLNNLATLLQDLGEPERALPLLDEAIKHHPEMAETRSNYLIGLQYLPHVTPQQLHASAKAWGDWAMTLQAQNIRGQTTFNPSIP